MSDTVTAEVQDLLQQWSEAYRAKDVDTLLGFAIGDDVQRSVPVSTRCASAWTSTGRRPSGTSPKPMRHR